MIMMIYLVIVLVKIKKNLRNLNRKINNEIREEVAELFQDFSTEVGSLKTTKDAEKLATKIEQIAKECKNKKLLLSFFNEIALRAQKILDTDSIQQLLKLYSDTFNQKIIEEKKKDKKKQKLDQKAFLNAGKGTQNATTEIVNLK